MLSSYSNPEAAFGGTTRMLTLIESIYATVQDPSLWGEVMRRLNAALGGETLALFASFPGNACDILGLSDMPMDVWQPFAAYYATINPLMPRCEAMLAPDETWFSHKVISAAEMRATECGNDFYRPHKMDHFAGIRLQLGGGAVANLSCQRSSAQGEFDGGTDVIYNTLRPHLQRALLLHQQFGNLQAESLGLRAALEAFDHAVFALDAAGRVAFCNRQAELLSLASTALTPLQGRLTTWDAATNRTLQKLLAETVAAGCGKGLSAGGSMLIPQSTKKSPLRLTATPFSSKEVLSLQPVAALVFVNDPDAAPLSRATSLRTLYGLTPAEIRIAEMLLEGLEVREIANRVGITLETGRSHIKRILAKTGTPRQAELIRLILSIPGLGAGQG